MADFLSTDQLVLLTTIRDAPDPISVAMNDPDLREIWEMGLVDLYDTAPGGETRWTVTTSGRERLTRDTVTGTHIPKQRGRRNRCHRNLSSSSVLLCFSSVSTFA